jgi:hypothetical protein
MNSKKGPTPKQEAGLGLSLDAVSRRLHELKVSAPEDDTRKRKLPGTYSAAIVHTVHRKPGTRGVVSTAMTNPYLEVINTAAARHITDAELYEPRTIITEAQTGAWKKVIEVEADRGLVAGQILRLKERGIVVFFPQFHLNLLGDEIEDWSEAILEKELGIGVEQTR